MFPAPEISASDLCPEFFLLAGCRQYTRTRAGPGRGGEEPDQGGSRAREGGSRGGSGAGQGRVRDGDGEGRATRVLEARLGAGLGNNSEYPSFGAIFHPHLRS